MKATSYPVFTGTLVLLASSFAVVGCNSVPTRDTTADFSTASAFAEPISGVRVPEPTFTERPEYPWSLKRAGIMGTVSVRCSVNEQGQVTNLKVVSTTHEDFVNPALYALRRWQFKPGMRDGAPVAMDIIVPIRFALED